jgi:DNA polymerase I
MSRPLLVVDGDSFAHRAYHALPKSIRRRGNRGGGAIVGFANFLLRLYENEQPRAVLVGWDTLDVPTYRHRALAAYQGGRQFDAELLDQLAVLPQFVAACGFVTVKAPGYEADDFLAAAVASEERRGGTAAVASGDRDAFQLASERTTLLHPLRGGEMARIGPAEVRERYGVEPGQVPDFIALRGDPSDKLPGAKGVGPKAQELRLYRSIATMDASAPLPSLCDQTPTWAEASTLARDWELNRLADRLADIASTTNHAFGKS